MSLCCLGRRLVRGVRAPVVSHATILGRPRSCPFTEIRNNRVVEIAEDVGSSGRGRARPAPAGLLGARARVARVLLEGGSNTAAGLAETLGLTPAAVRKHLDELLDMGFVEASERPQFGPDRRSRGRGRPARWYTLTAVGREGFENGYDDLAVSALRFLADSSDGDAVMEFARKRVAELERRYSKALEGLTGEARVRAISEELSSEGYVAAVVPVSGGLQICQHHCPVAHVAEEFPQFCEAEAEVFGRLLGTHVLRLATIAHGDGICTTHVPTTAPGSERNTA
jgi:predicted ArsR family transcriptional regulator